MNTISLFWEKLILWRLTVIAGGLIALSFSSMSFSAPTVRDHLQNVSKSEYQTSMNIWLDGAIAAFLAGNARLTLTRKAVPLFCLPKGQSINSADAMKLIEQGVGQRKWKDFVPLTTVLLDALQRSYPCNKNKR